MTREPEFTARRDSLGYQPVRKQVQDVDFKQSLALGKGQHCDFEAQERTNLERIRINRS